MPAMPDYTRAPANAPAPSRVAPARIGPGARDGGRTSSSVPLRPLPAWPLLDVKPPSLRELIDYTRSGDWVPGVGPGWLEWLGRAYGYVIAVPVVAALIAMAWLVARPSRVAGAVLVTGLVTLVWWLQPS